MKEFFRKNKWSIAYWMVLLFLVAYFAPSQNRYYLDQDIRQFKSQYLIPFLLWAFLLIAVGSFVYIIIVTKSIRKSLLLSLFLSLAFVFVIFCFQSIFLGIALFANRQVEKEKITRVYMASFLPGTDNTKKNLNLFDPVTKQIQLDSRLANVLYRPGLKQNDTLVLEMKKGFLGVAYISDP